MLGAVAEGHDPAALKASERAKPTVAQLAERYQTDHVDLKNKPSTSKEFKRLLNKHILEAWKSRHAASITSDDVAKLHHSLRQTPRVANQVLAVASKMFSLAERWGMRPQRSNPCIGIQRYAETPRERFASEAELKRLGEALSQMEATDGILPEAAGAIRLLALSGLRLSEALNLLWSDVDLEGGRLLIREAKAGGRMHVIGGATIALLECQSQKTSWVFPARDGTRPLPIRTLEKSWARLRGTADLPGLRIHDLRHGYGTFAGQAGANAFLVRDALGHKTLAMTGRYVNRDDSPLRVLADQVSDRISLALAGPSSDGAPPTETVDKLEEE